MRNIYTGETEAVWYLSGRIDLGQQSHDMVCSVVRPTSLRCGHDGVCGKRVRSVVVCVFRAPRPGLTETRATCCALHLELLPIERGSIVTFLVTSIRWERTHGTRTYRIAQASRHTLLNGETISTATFRSKRHPQPQMNQKINACVNS